jgi:tripartite-type tricarboxylate transporter receptor subunit TctC
MIHSKHMLSAILLGASLALAAGAVLAQGYPAKPVRMVVPYPPGGSADILARTVGQKLSERIGQPVVIENRPGAGASVGAKAVAIAPADGYTLLLGTVSSHAMSPATNAVGYDPVKDFTPIAEIASIPFVVLANPELPVKNIADLIALAKAKPGQVTYASAGSGTSNHLAGELLGMAAGIKMLHVPYKGSAPALNDLLGGQVNTMFDLQLTAMPQIKSGKVRALAMTGAKRSALLPDVPTVREAGIPNYEVTAWFGFFGPAGMPRPVVDRLNTELNAIMRLPDIRSKFAELGVETESGSADEFSAFVRSEAVKWAGVIKAAGIVSQ